MAKFLKAVVVVPKTRERRENFVCHLFVSVHLSTVPACVATQNQKKRLTFHDIRRRRTGMFAIIQQVDNIVIGKTVTILDIICHVVDIVLTSAQFTRIMTHVVDANHDGPTLPRKVGRQNGKGIVQIRGARTGKLRDLFKTLGLEFFANRKKRFLEGKILSGILVIRIRRVEQSRRQGSAGTAGWIREFERTNVRYYMVVGSLIKQEKQAKQVSKQERKS